MGGLFLNIQLSRLKGRAHSPGRAALIVEPEAQSYLVEALSRARTHVGIRDGYGAKQNQQNDFAGVLSAFRYLGAITQQEEHTSNRKMPVALGYELPDTAPAGVSQATYESCGR